nr:MAG TPA: PglZ domain protein [Caudoviricetes sp.]
MAITSNHGFVDILRKSRASGQFWSFYSYEKIEVLKKEYI